jgi:hypothetical protein
MKTKTGFLVMFLPFVCFADGVRHVDYDVDGTAKYANLTFRNENGGMDQKQVQLPFHVESYVRGGSLVPLSAQKVRVTRPDSLRLRSAKELANGRDGVVHVAIRVNAIVLQEASADAPFGIATARGRVE